MIIEGHQGVHNLQNHKLNYEMQINGQFAIQYLVMIRSRLVFCLLTYFHDV